MTSKGKGKGKAVVRKTTRINTAVQEVRHIVYYGFMTTTNLYQRPQFKQATANTADAGASTQATAAPAQTVPLPETVAAADEDEDEDILGVIVDPLTATADDTSIELVFNEDAKINIRHQRPIVKKVLLHVVNELIADFAFHHGIYPVDARFDAQRVIAAEVAANLGHPDMRNKIETDLPYAKDVVGLVGDCYIPR